MNLLDRHAALHAELEARAWATLEHASQQRVADAQAAWQTFVTLLRAHMAYEDAHVLPLYAPHAPSTGPGRLDNVQGDHTILLRGVDAVDAWLATLDVQSAVRPILEQLPLLYRLLQTLEHHTVREQQHMYPCIALTQNPAQVAVIATALSQAVSSPSVS